MKQGTRLYINITNHCNIDCPFCCMYSGRDKGTYMNEDTFQGIIDDVSGGFELQLEGGEPLCHNQVLEFIEYAIATGRCNRVIILTNGIKLPEYFEEFKRIAQTYKIEVLIKISINYYINQNVPNHIENVKRLYEESKSINGLKIWCNVRKRKQGDEALEQELIKYGLAEISNVFYLQAYGRLTGSDYEGPVIVQNIENWKIYASDGSCFGTDLIGRSEHEKGLE